MISRFQKKTQLKNVSLLISGTIVSQLILVGSSPILTRLFDGEQFGIYGSLISIATILSVVMTFRYEIPIALEKRWKNSIVLFRLSSLVSLLTLGIFLIPSLLFSDAIVRLMSWDIPHQALFLSVLIGFCTAYYGVIDFLLVRNSQFKLVSTITVVKSIAMVSTQIGISFIIESFYGLVYGQIVGLLLAVCIALLFLRKRRAIFRYRISLDIIKELAVKYRNFPRYNLPQSLINAVSQNIPTLLLASLFSLETAGYYWFTIRILRIPVMTIGNAIRKIFYNRVTDLALLNKDVYYTEFKKTTGLMSLAGIVITLPIFLFSTNLFSFFFGEEWIVAGKYASILSPAIILSALVNIPSVVTIQVFNKQRSHLAIEVGLIICRVLALYVGYHFDSAIMSIILFSLVGFIFNGGLVFYSYRLIRSETYEK